MMQRSKSCDPRRLELFLHNRLPGDLQRELEAHLLICQDCRTKLDELAGGENWWTDVRRYLGGDGASEFIHTKDFSDARPTSPTGLEFLESSDNPKALGRLGPYEILEILGQGGWGVVLKAFDPALHRSVAIKVLAAPFAANGAARKRFAREAQAAAAIMHDNVVPVHAINSDATPPYLVMAFIPGQSLQQRLDRCGQLEIREILRIGMQTAAGLTAAHAQGIVHRDIKPANIMLEDGFERVRITDFGLARAVDDATITQSGAVAGTPQYMAPEQAGGEMVDERADLFALGSTLYAMCTGRAPFRGNTGLAILRQVCDAEPTPIRSINPDIPPWLAGIVRKLHAKDPANRFQTAAEVAGLLERCLAHVQKPDANPLPSVAAELGRQVGSPKPRGQRRPWLARATGLALVAATALTFLLFGQQPRVGDEVAPQWSAELSDPNEAPGASQEPLLSPEAFRKESDVLRGQLDQLLQSMTAESNTGDLELDAALEQARRQADRLQGQLTPSSDRSGDPIKRQMDLIRRRLEQLQQREKQ
jgi:serine/threonine protein kinase